MKQEWDEWLMTDVPQPAAPLCSVHTASADARRLAEHAYKSSQTPRDMTGNPDAVMCTRAQDLHELRLTHCGMVCNSREAPMQLLTALCALRR